MGLAAEDETRWYRSKGETKSVNHGLSFGYKNLSSGAVLFAQCFPR